MMITVNKSNIDTLIVLLEKLKVVDAQASPLELIKLIICALASLVADILLFIPENQILLKKIIAGIANALKIVCDFIPLKV